MKLDPDVTEKVDDILRDCAVIYGGCVEVTKSCKSKLARAIQEERNRKEK